MSTSHSATYIVVFQVTIILVFLSILKIIPERNLFLNAFSDDNNTSIRIALTTVSTWTGGCTNIINQSKPRVVLT